MKYFIYASAIEQVIAAAIIEEYNHFKNIPY